MIRQTGRERRCRLRLRVHRRRGDAHDDGRAHDALQPVDRGRRADGLCQSGRHHLRVPARPSARARRRRMGAGRRHGGVMASEPGRRADDEQVIDVSADCAGRDLGHQPRSERRRRRTDSRSRGPAAGRARRGARGAAVHGLRSRRIGVRAAAWTSPSSARAPTRGLSDLRAAADVVRGQRVARHVRGAGRARIARSAARGGSAKGCTRCSSRPASSGASPAARSASA